MTFYYEIAIIEWLFFLRLNLIVNNAIKYASEAQDRMEYK